MQVMHVIARRDHRLEHANGSFAPIRDIVYRPYGASAAEAGHQAWARKGSSRGQQLTAPTSSFARQATVRILDAITRSEFPIAGEGNCL